MTVHSLLTWVWPKILHRRACDLGMKPARDMESRSLLYRLTSSTCTLFLRKGRDYFLEAAIHQVKKRTSQPSFKELNPTLAVGFATVKSYKCDMSTVMAQEPEG